MPSAANVNPGARQMAKGSGGPRRKPPRHPQNVEAGGQATSNNTNGNSTKKTKPKRSEVPCKAWKAGSCARGTKCWFRHDLEAQQDRNVVVQVNQLAEQVRKLGLNDREQEEQRDVLTHEEEQQRDERRRHQEARERRGHREQARIADEQRIQKALLEREATRQARLDEQAVRKARDAEYLTRMADISQEEATRMTKHFILGSLVTFGAGLDIRHLITGFECCTVQIKNLPAEVSEAEIANIFLDQGIEAGRFQILENQATSGRRRTAKFITDAEIGEVMALGLEGVVFREDKLDLEVGPYNLPGRMGASGVRDTDTVTISWKAPSTRFIAEFDDMETTRRQAQALNRKVFMGRRVKVVVNTPPRGRKIPLFNPRSVIISNLDPDVDRQSIRDFTGATVVEEMRPGFAQQSGHLDFDALSCYIAEISTGLVSLENLNNFQKTLDGMVTVKARFNSREEAERVYLLLSKGTFPWSINMLESTFWLHLPALMQYTLTIPAAQYSAQKHQWDSLVESIKHRNACNLFITGLRAVDVVQMRIVGNVKEAVGALKVRVENLAAGEKIEGWHPSLGHSRSQFIRAVVEDTGGFLRADHRQKVLKAYGKPDDVDAIRTMVAAELQKLASKEWSFTLQKQSVGFFIRQGVPALQEMFGDENVLFNATSRIITVRGEEARHTLKSFISQSVEAKIPVAASIPAEQICPVCYDRVSDPLVLGCKHVYCTPCMRHLLTSAEESDKFPLTCVGEECGELIPIPIVQRFLTPADFARLLEAAFTFHVTTNPRSLKYCRTPDCVQIYRATEEKARTDCAVQCPSCFSVVCSACHEDGHEGMTCADARLLRDRDDMSEAWIRQAKKCPNCQVPIEKSGGCNHMSCRCGAHICWRCMGVFSKDTIYNHMNTEHGGINDEETIPERINYDQPVLLQTRGAREEERAPTNGVTILVPLRRHQEPQHEDTDILGRMGRTQLIRPVGRSYLQRLEENRNAQRLRRARLVEQDIVQKVPRIRQRLIEGCQAVLQEERRQIWDGELELSLFGDHTRIRPW